MLSASYWEVENAVIVFVTSEEGDVLITVI